jgi:hypothetical protein
MRFSRREDLAGLSGYIFEESFKLIPESCTKYRSEALQAAVDSWCKIQVITHSEYPVTRGDA